MLGPGLARDLPPRVEMVRHSPPTHDSGAGRTPRSNLNLLLSFEPEAGRAGTLGQLEALLAPMGIHSVVAGSVDEASDLMGSLTVHIAVVDWTIPLSPGQPRPAGGRVLQLLSRLDPAPPTVIVRPPQPEARVSARGLAEALRDGAFAVIDRPIRLETMLEVMRRVVRRHYADHWPAA